MISTMETTPSNGDEGKKTRGDGYARNNAGTTTECQDTAGMMSNDERAVRWEDVGNE